MTVLPLQTVVARGTSPLDSNVVSVSSFNTGGNAYNVVPDTVLLGGTYRSLTHNGMLWMQQEFEKVKCFSCCDYSGLAASNVLLMLCLA